MYYGLSYGTALAETVFPEIKATSGGTSQWNFPGTYSASLPSGIEAGELLVLILMHPNASGEIATPAGWWPVRTDSRLSIFARFATGSNPAPSFTRDDGFWAHVVYRIAGAAGVAATVAAASGGYLPLPALAAPWGSTKNLWIGAVGRLGGDAIGGTPANYARDRVADFYWSWMIASSRKRAIATETGGAYSGDNDTYARVARIAVRPAA
ncbi:hypothetical protein [Oricola indica]|jgi:hypothetical protein|uniref:hypothetical protein n=1 Tax=Oricola indica TaxID=2872591 RepID=UPI001CBD3E9F|nr:hypothetical protein [Oricola indica]